MFLKFRVLPIATAILLFLCSSTPTNAGSEPENVRNYVEELRQVINGSFASKDERSSGLRIKFLVYKDGFIANPELSTITSDPQQDRKCLRAILKAMNQGLVSPFNCPAAVDVTFDRNLSINVARCPSNSSSKKSAEKLIHESNIKVSKKQKALQKCFEERIHAFDLISAFASDPANTSLKNEIAQALEKIGINPESKEQLKVLARYAIGDTSLRMLDPEKSRKGLQQPIGLYLLVWQNKRADIEEGLFNTYATSIALKGLQNYDGLSQTQKILIEKGKLFEFADQLNLAKHWYQRAMKGEGIQSLEASGMYNQLKPTVQLPVVSPGIVSNSIKPTGTTFSDIEKLLWWLPEDTEVIYAARGPFDSNTGSDLAKKDLRATVLVYPQPEEISKTSLDIDLKSILLSVHAAKNFRHPSDLGGSPSDDCMITVFGPESKQEPVKYWKLMKNHAQRSFSINNIPVLEYHCASEADHCKVFICIPAEGVLLATSEKSDLITVLKRMGHKFPNRALPKTLPEWKFQDKKCDFWAIRHYDWKTGPLDQTSLKCFVTRSGIINDTTAKGVIFQHKTGSDTAKITFLTANKDVRALLVDLWSAKLDPRETQERVQEISNSSGDRLEMKLNVSKNTIPGISFILLYAMGTMICV